MKPAKVDLHIYAGATFSPSFVWKSGTPAEPMDLTGCTARLQARRDARAGTVLLDMTTENNRILLPEGGEGKIELRLTDEETSAILWDQGVYQLEVAFPDGSVRRLLEGKITVSPEITR